MCSFKCPSGIYNVKAANLNSRVRSVMAVSKLLATVPGVESDGQLVTLLGWTNSAASFAASWSSLCK